MWDTGYLQQWAHELGIGRDPASTCRAPPRACCRPSSGATSSPPKANWKERPWSAGDNVQLATGQGDLQTNPLQMAIAYATLGNGGTVVTPHVGKEIEDAAGRVLKEFDPPARSATSTSTRPTAPTILEGLHEAAQNGGGTSFDVFGELPDRGRRQDRDGAATATRTSPGTRCWRRIRTRRSSPS